MSNTHKQIQQVKNLNYSWFLDNFDNLKSHYYDQWVAIYEQRIVAHNFNLLHHVLLLRPQYISSRASRMVSKLDF